MARTKQPHSARERLLAAADELFYRHGIASTGVDAVVSRANVAIGSLYNNFDGKDGLVAAYLEDRDRRWRDQWEAAIAEQQDATERVLAIFAAMEQWNRDLTHNRGCAHTGAALQLDAASPGAAVAAEHKRHIRQRLHELVAATDVPDPDHVARDIMLVYEGMLGSLATDLDTDPIERARTLAATILRLGRTAETG